MSGTVNRGPAAASENRAALLRSARELFYERGYDIPFSSIAKDAGVSQAVLYRHFPTKAAIASAVFDENLVELENLATDVVHGGFRKAWTRLVEMTVETRAFIDAALAQKGNGDETSLEARLRATMADALDRAHDNGEFLDVDIDTVMLTERIIYGAVATASDRESAREDVRQALEIIEWTSIRRTNSAAH